LHLGVDSLLDLTDNQYQQDGNAYPLVTEWTNLFLDPETTCGARKQLWLLVMNRNAPWCWW